MEEQGPTLRILSLVIHIDQDSVIHFFPNNPNMWFGLGVESEQRIMRLCPFCSKRIRSYRMFCSYFVGQVLMWNRLTNGDMGNMEIMFCSLINEVL